MVAWVVINRLHLPRAARRTRLARTLCSIRVLPLPALLFNVPTCKPLNVLTSPILPRSHSHFGPHLTPVPQKSAPFFSYTYMEPIFQPLCFQIHACNGGGTPPPQAANLRSFQRCNVFPSYPRSFRTFAHSFALFCTRAKINPFLFNRFRTLCAKHPGWGASC
jgi:hypothetical protein